MLDVRFIFISLIGRGVNVANGDALAEQVYLASLLREVIGPGPNGRDSGRVIEQ